MFLDYMLIPLTIAVVILTFIIGYDLGKNVGARQILDYVDDLADCLYHGGRNLPNVKKRRPLKD